MDLKIGRREGGIEGRRAKIVHPKVEGSQFLGLMRELDIKTDGAWVAGVLERYGRVSSSYRW